MKQTAKEIGYVDFITLLQQLQTKMSEAIYNLLSKTNNNSAAGLELNNCVIVKTQNDMNWGDDGIISLKVSSVRASQVDQSPLHVIEVVDDTIDDPAHSDEWSVVTDIDSLCDLYNQVWDTLTINE